MFPYFVPRVEFSCPTTIQTCMKDTLNPIWVKQKAENPILFARIQCPCFSKNRSGFPALKRGH